MAKTLANTTEILRHARLSFLQLQITRKTKFKMMCDSSYFSVLADSSTDSGIIEQEWRIEQNRKVTLTLLEIVQKKK